MALEQIQTPPDEPLFSHLELSREVNGVRAVTIQPQVRPEGSLSPNPPYNLLQQAFAVYGEGGDAEQMIGTFALDWMCPALTSRHEQFGTFQFSRIQLEPDFQGRIDEASGQRIPGIGKDLYRHVARHAVPPDGMRFEQHHFPYFLIAEIRSNLNLTSRNMWRSLFKSGEATQMASGYYIFNTPTDGGVSSMDVNAA